MSEKTVSFHIKNNDYFGTLATVLDLINQDVEKNGFVKKHADLLERKKNELLYLQSKYKIIKIV